jgi:hypothetical protein
MHSFALLRLSFLASFLSIFECLELQLFMSKGLIAYDGSYIPFLLHFDDRVWFSRLQSCLGTNDIK